MYKECKTESSLRRQTAIEECLVAQMRVKDYEEIHISDICREVGISRTVFYRYFESKADVLDAWIDRAVNAFSEPRWHTRVSDDPLTEGTLHFVRFWVEHRDVPELLIRQNMMDLLIQKCIRYASGNPRIHELMGIESNSPAARRALVFSAYGVLGVMCDWQRGGFQESEDEAVELLKGLLLNPLCRPENVLGGEPAEI